MIFVISGSFLAEKSGLLRVIIDWVESCVSRVFGVVCRGIYSCRLSPATARADRISSSQLRVPLHQIYVGDGQSTLSFMLEMASPPCQNIHTLRTHSMSWQTF